MSTNLYRATACSLIATTHASKIGASFSTASLDVMQHPSPREALEVGLLDTSGVYVGQGADPGAYFARIAQDIRHNACEPFPVTAVVMPPGFPEHPIGASISGLCMAHQRGYWLVYRPEDDQFYCFWGQDVSNLGAHGVFGSPLYCWSA